MSRWFWIGGLGLVIYWCSSSTDPNDRQYYSLQLAQTVVDEFKLDLVCEDKQVDELVALIKQASGMNPGIYVADVVFRGDKK